MSTSESINQESSEKINILKENTTITVDQYNQEKINREYNDLYMKSTQATNNEIKKKEKVKIYNLSVKEIIGKASQTYIDVINELTVLVNNKNINIYAIVDIISRKDRLIYVGLLIVIISFMMAFVFIAD
jgi:hypothetical protein